TFRRLSATRRERDLRRREQLCSSATRDCPGGCAATGFRGSAFPQEQPAPGAESNYVVPCLQSDGKSPAALWQSAQLRPAALRPGELWAAATMAAAEPAGVSAR